MNLLDQYVKILRGGGYRIFYTLDAPHGHNFERFIKLSHDLTPINLLSVQLFDRFKLEFGLNIFEYFNLIVFSEEIGITSLPVNNFSPLGTYTIHNPIFYRFTVEI